MLVRDINHDCSCCVSVLLRLGLQLILLWLEEVFNNGINQLVQFLLQVDHITVKEREER